MRSTSGSPAYGKDSRDAKHVGFPYLRKGLPRCEARRVPLPTGRTPAMRSTSGSPTYHTP